MIVNKVFGAAWAAVALLSCSPSPTSAGAANPTANGQSAAPAPPSLYGRWRILQVDGVPARTFPGQAEVEPSVSFARGSYGGTTGCNGFGGNGLAVGDRWFADAPVATQQGCGALTAQEDGIFRVLAGGPAVHWEGPDVAVLRTAEGALRLRRAGPSTRLPAPPPMLLAGTRWDLGALDGRAAAEPGARTPPRLGFEADRWTLETPCGAREGAWRQGEGAVVLVAGTGTPRACSPAQAHASDALARMIAGRLHYIIGGNDELVLGGSEHWATGRRDATMDEGEADLLSGSWRIRAVDGAPPPLGERGPELNFGPGMFGVWDGCQHSEGVAIVSRRQLFTHGSGMVTMANCPETRARTAINQVVAAEPRIARNAGGGLALIASSGRLDLERVSARVFGVGVRTRLRTGTFDLMTGTRTRARLTVGPGQGFSVSLPCGTWSGRWRPGRGAGGAIARFGPDRPAPACDGDEGAMRLYNFFTGDVLATVGPNDDIALFVSRSESLAARVAPAR